MRFKRSVCVGMGAIVAAGAIASADHIKTFEFPIDVDQTVPMADVTGFSPSGMGVVTLNTDTNLLEWEITYSGLTGDIVAPGAHFHGPAGVGETGGLQVDIVGDAAGTGSGMPAPQPSSGVLMGSFTVSDQQETDILNGLWYVNIHTAANQPGEIRGQVTPAPASLGLLVAAGLAGGGRRRR
ncbi:MAG: CHRD domain-containing protein [Phycisphaerales bacterium JB037]